MKPVNETLNGQPVAHRELLEELTALGFGGKTAAKLIREHGPETIGRQLDWLPHRVPARSPAGLLRRAIEQQWPEPAKLRATEVLDRWGWEFARHFYAAYGGNRGEPVNEPSPRDAETADTFAQRLLAMWPEESRIGEWGRQLGRTAREQRHPFPSLQLAIRQHGDAFLVRIGKERSLEQAQDDIRDREAHEQAYRPAWLAWIGQREEETRDTRPDEYARFLAKRERDRAELAASRTPWDAATLPSFDRDSSRLHAFRQFSGLLDFWAWDAEFNNQRFNPNQTNP